MEREMRSPGWGGWGAGLVVVSAMKVMERNDKGP